MSIMYTRWLFIDSLSKTPSQLFVFHPMFGGQVDAVHFSLYVNGFFFRHEGLVGPVSDWGADYLQRVGLPATSESPTWCSCSGLFGAVTSTCEKSDVPELLIFKLSRGISISTSHVDSCMANIKHWHSLHCVAYIKEAIYGFSQLDRCTAFVTWSWAVDAVDTMRFSCGFVNHVLYIAGWFSLGIIDIYGWLGVPPWPWTYPCGCYVTMMLSSRYRGSCGHWAWQWSPTIHRDGIRRGTLSIPTLVGHSYSPDFLLAFCIFLTWLAAFSRHPNGCLPILVGTGYVWSIVVRYGSHIFTFASIFSMSG